MHLDCMITYRLQLTPEEFSTLGKALFASDDPKAKELNIAITRSRREQALLTTEKATKAWEKAEFGGDKEK